GRRAVGRAGPDDSHLPGKSAAAGGAGAADGLLPVEPLLLLPLLLLPPQLLADPGAEVAGAGRRRLHAAAGLHGLPAVPRTELALRRLRGASLPSRLPLLARPVLNCRARRRDSGGVGLPGRE